MLKQTKKKTTTTKELKTFYFCKNNTRYFFISFANITAFIYLFTSFSKQNTEDLKSQKKSLIVLHVMTKTTFKYY